MRFLLQRQIRVMARRWPVSGAHAALHDVRQRASVHARGLRRQDHGVLDLHLSALLSFRLSYEICYEDLTLLQVSLFIITVESENVFYSSFEPDRQRPTGLRAFLVKRTETWPMFSMNFRGASGGRGNARILNPSQLSVVGWAAALRLRLCQFKLILLLRKFRTYL